MSINIYGAGIAGLSLAASLSENHFENYKIFEKASDIRKSDTAIQLGFNCFQALKDLAIASNCKAIINYEKIPKDKDWPKGDKWDEYYFFGGEDYELVFSLPKKWAENLSKLDKDMNEIGFFADGEPSIEFKDSYRNKLLTNTPFKHF